MAYATQEDVEDALGRPITSTESSLVDNLLEQATDLVVGYLGRDLDTVPNPVARVVATMVAAVFTKPATTTSDYSASGYNTSREVATIQVGTESATTTGPWLTKTLRLRLKPFRRGMFSIKVVAGS